MNNKKLSIVKITIKIFVDRVCDDYYTGDLTESILLLYIWVIIDYFPRIRLCIDFIDYTLNKIVYSIKCYLLYLLYLQLSSY